MQGFRQPEFNRRRLLAGAVGASITPWMPLSRVLADTFDSSGMKFGLVTYLWGRDLALPVLLKTCAEAGVGGIELRTTHAHDVEPGLSPVQRERIRSEIEASGVVLVGLGSDERFDSPDPERFRSAVEATRAFLKLSHDLGGGGVKVKPDRFHPGESRERTIARIATGLREVGRTAMDLGQQVRLEVHGDCADPEVIDAIMQQVDTPAVRVCWNCNPRDLDDPGFEAGFKRLRPYFGETLHVRELDDGSYPFSMLIRMLAESRWNGWVLLEAHSAPGPLERREADLRRQRRLFEGMLERSSTTPSPRRLTITTTPHEKGIVIKAEGQHLASTHRTEQGPVLFPITVPGGGRIVRSHPIETLAGESTDHPHHRSLWLAHGDVDGHDFWHDPEAGVHLISEEVLLSDCESAVIRWKAEWRAGDAVILEEHRTMTFSATEQSGHIAFDITLVPAGESVTFGDTKEGFFAIRLAPSLKVEGGPSARGRLQNAEGLANRAAWGKRSPWILAEGPLEGRLVRVRLGDDPDNIRHPTWWHARTYGLLAANPFGLRAFEGGEDPGALVVTREQPLRLRYQLDFDAR